MFAGSGRHGAEAAGTGGVVGQREVEFGGAEIGPLHGREVELGLRAFPEQEIGEAAVAAGADEEIDVLGAQPLGQGFGGEAVCRGGEDGVAGGIVDGDAQVQALAAGGGALGRADGAGKAEGDAIAPAEYGDADAVAA